MLPDTLLRLPAVKAATGLSRSTIYDRVRKGTFPAPVSLGGNAVGWPASEVGAWIQSRIDEGRTQAVDPVNQLTGERSRSRCSYT
jgi:prophage regulatory protein